MEQAAGCGEFAERAAGSWIDTATLVAMVRRRALTGDLFDAYADRRHGVFESVTEAIQIGREPAYRWTSSTSDCRTRLWGKMAGINREYSNQARANGQLVERMSIHIARGRTIVVDYSPWAHRVGRTRCWPIERSEAAAAAGERN